MTDTKITYIDIQYPCLDNVEHIAYIGISLTIAGPNSSFRPARKEIGDVMLLIIRDYSYEDSSIVFNGIKDGKENDIEIGLIGLVNAIPLNNLPFDQLDHFRFNSNFTGRFCLIGVANMLTEKVKNILF